MGLFDNIRSKTDTTTARVLFAAVVVVFVFSFINMGFGGRTVTYAKVNGKRITDLDLQKRMRVVQRQMQSGSLNEDEQEELKNNVLDRLIVEAAVLDKASKMGIEVSDTEINLIVLQNPGFQDAAGDFSEELFEQAVKQEGYGSKAKFEDKLRQDLTYDKLRSAVSATVLVTEEEARTIAEQSMVTIDLEWIRLSSSMVSVDITTDEITKEIEENKTSIEETYNQDLPFKYQKPERVDLQRLILPFTVENKTDVSAEATSLLDKVVLGEPLSTFIVERNPSAVNEGKLLEAAREQLDVGVADHVFGDDGETVKIIETNNAFIIVQRLERYDAETVSFEIASQDIARSRLQDSLSQKALQEKAAEIKDKWVNGNFTEEELLMYTPQTASAISPIDPKIPGLGNSPELFEALSTVSEVGHLPIPYETLGGLVLANVTNITKPSADELEQRSKLEITRLRRQREATTWQAFELTAKQQATVEETWKQWQQ